MVKTSKAGGRPSHKICSVHPKQQVTFHCVETGMNICNLCVPDNAGHTIKILKNELAELFQPWKKLEWRLKQTARFLLENK